MTIHREILEFSQMTDEQIEKILKENKIALTVPETRQIEKILGRPPSLTEAVIWGIQGSEHSSYRSSRDHLKKLPTQAPNVILGPCEDSGIIEFARIGDKRYGIIISHESHNHPSQVVPYEGAATGIGGIVRDIACMGGRVIASADPLRFGDIQTNQTKLITEGVISGIAGYGNPIGVPNIAGDTYFHPSFSTNCLVNVVALGLVEESDIIHSRAPMGAGEDGYDIIIVGKPTDISGMGGASFASLELDEADREANKGAVQEPNPFLKRHILRSTYDLFKILKAAGDLDKVGFKDMGAGGNMCASVELVDSAGYGADINLDKIHVSMENLHPSVIAASETQERFCWICHPDLTQKILDHYNKKWDLPNVAKNARASHVGKVTTENYVLRHQGQVVCDAPSSDITEGLKYDREFHAPERHFEEPDLSEPHDYNEPLLKLLAHENIASRLPIYENYDKNVQGISIFESGDADSGLIAPLRDHDVPEDAQKIGVALTVDANPLYGQISPYWQAVNAVVEGQRNIAAIGATPICVTDCLNYGNPEKPHQMWEFVEGIRGITDALKGLPLKEHPDYPTPVISGNVSFYNESKEGSVSPSAVIATLGRIEDYHQAITPVLKKSGSQLFLIGPRQNELGGSAYYNLLNQTGAHVPQPDLAQACQEIWLTIDLIQAGLVLSCHDISDGGLAVCLAEMMIGGRAQGQLGAKIDIADIGENPLRVDTRLFSETGGFILEIPPGKTKTAQTLAEKYQIKLIPLGQTQTNPSLLILNDQEEIIDLRLETLKKTWLNGLRDKLR